MVSVLSLSVHCRMKSPCLLALGHPTLQFLLFPAMTPPVKRVPVPEPFLHLLLPDCRPRPSPSDWAPTASPRRQQSSSDSSASSATAEAAMVFMAGTGGDGDGDRRRVTGRLPLTHSSPHTHHTHTRLSLLPAHAYPGHSSVPPARPGPAQPGSAPGAWEEGRAPPVSLGRASPRRGRSPGKRIFANWRDSTTCFAGAAYNGVK